jgi:hypothetical protein
MLRESWLAALVGSSAGDAVTRAWLGPSERGMCGWLENGRTGHSVLATNPATAQAITMGSQMRSGTRRLNSEATLLMRAFPCPPA